MTEGCSSIAMPAEKLRELVRSCLDRIKAERERQKREAIEKERARALRNPFRRLFKLAPPTDEQIVARLSYGMISVMDYIERHKHDEEQAAYRLLNATEHADVVHVSTEDLYWIT